MARTIIELDAPTYWASALINNDVESLDADDLADLNTWLDNEGVELQQCLSVKDDGNEDGNFESYYTPFYFPGKNVFLSCEVYTYMFLVEGDAS